MSVGIQLESEAPAPRKAFHVGIMAPFLLATFASACLLFLIQPMFAKELLPRLGGTPAVWNTCMAFYQLALLLGYGYAHLLTRITNVRWQLLIHLVLLLTALLVLPVRLPPEWMPPTEANPVWWLLSVLALCAGLPFWLVSTSSPLLLRWFSFTDHPAASDPYFLYAASNTGSLLGLVSYPFLVEPYLRLGDQSILWAVGYVILCGLFGCVSLILWISPTAAIRRIPGSRAREAVDHAGRQSIGMRRRLYCVFLAFVPSSLLLGVTTYLSTDVASVPLMWVIPLGLYLVSFIIVFSAQARIPYHSLLNNVLPGLAVYVSVSQFYASSLPVWASSSAHLACFFVIALVGHGKLAQLRPEPSCLTEYFFLISLGGVLGGAFNAFVAPLIFPWSIEYQLVIGLALLLRFSLPAGTALRSVVPRQLRLMVVVVLIYGVIYAAIAAGVIDWFQLPGLEGNRMATIALCGIPLLAFARRPIAFALIIAMLPLIFLQMESARADRLSICRSFFGVHRVVQEQDFVTYLQGTTVHGMQQTDPDRKCLPLTYYHPTGPAGQVLQSLNRRGVQRVAIMGLGTGSLGCYAQPGQEWVFYEIDPQVKEIAIGGDFTFLSDCVPRQTQCRIVLGDGRLRLAESAEGRYDLIVLDVFSSDAIPMHLLTREAFQMYQRKLAPGGAILVHISSRFFDLSPLIGNLSHELQWLAFVARDVELSADQQQEGKTPSDWALLVQQPSDVEVLRDTARWQKLEHLPTFRTWTDEYSSIVPVLR